MQARRWRLDTTHATALCPIVHRTPHCPPQLPHPNTLTDLLLVKLEDKPLIPRQKLLRAVNMRHRHRPRYRQRQHRQLAVLNVEREAVQRVEGSGRQVLQRDGGSLFDGVTGGYD